MNRYKEKELCRYVIADLSQPTNYIMSLRNANYCFIDNIIKATKFTNRYIAEDICNASAQEMKLETPEIVKKGGTYGVKLRAGAPSIHMVRVDIDTEISPMVGDEKQTKELVDTLSNAGTEELWQSNIFGKSVYDLIRDGLTTKLVSLPQDVRSKFRGTLTRVVNEGANGLICLIL